MTKKLAANKPLDFEILGYKPTSPYDLIKKDYEIFVDPRIAYTMDNLGDTESAAIRLIYSILSESTEHPGSISFKLRHSFGLTIGQRRSVEKVFNTQLEFQAQLIELVQKIAGEAGQSPEAIAHRLQSLEKELRKDPNAALKDPILSPYMGDFLRLTAEQNQSTPYEACVATVRMQKVIPEWLLEHTLALHENIYSQLLEFEQADSIELLDADAGEATEVEASSNDSSSSEVIPLPTGTESDTTLSTGESES